MKRKLLSLSAALLATVFVVAACGGADTPQEQQGQQGQQAATPGPVVTPPPAPPDAGELEAGVEAADALAELFELQAQFPMYTTNPNPIIPGGTLAIAIASESSFPGLFLPTHSRDAMDGQIWGYVQTAFVSTNELLMLSQEGIAGWELDIEGHTMTLWIQNEAFWHDGVQVTLHDLAWAYYVIAHPDYSSVRFSNSITNVVGIQEYREGLVDYIAGIEVSEDGMRMVITFTEMQPAMLWGGDIWLSPIPRHIWENIPVADMEAHYHARDGMVGFGPWEFVNIVPGESVLLRANQNYWRGAPILDYMTVEIISMALIPLSHQEGRFDWSGWRNLDFHDFPNPTNYQYLSFMAASMGFNYFRLGSLDRETTPFSFVPRDPNHFIMNTELRRAIGFAIDQLTISMTLGGGFSRPAASVMSPFNALAWIDRTSVGFSPFNLELSAQILDDAGFTQFDSEGYRLDLDGNEMTIVWAMASATDQDIVFEMHQQNFRAIGLRLRLWLDRFADFQYLMEVVQQDTDDGIHMSSSGWSLGFNPNPRVLWGYGEPFNFARHSNDEMQNIIARISSVAALDDAYVAERYAEWQVAWYEAVPAIPVNWAVGLQAVNNRMTNYSLVRLDDTGREVALGATHLWAVTNTERYSE
jgi:peptide/nickel transport system substrate-binding protein